MAVFGVMVDALFGDPNLSAAATYTPSGGSASAVRVIRRAPSQDAPLFNTGASLPAYSADVRVSELTSPQEGDALVIGSDTFTVRKFEKDSERLVWKLDLDIQ